MMKTSRYLICVVLTGIVLVSSSGKLFAGPICRHEERSLVYLNEGNIELAIKEAKKAVSLNEDSFTGNIVLSRAYYSWGLYDKSIQHASRGIELEPDFWVSHYFLGLSYKGKGMYEEAVSKFEETLELDPRSAEAVYGELGHTMALMGDDDEAIEMLKRSIALSDEGQEDPIFRGYLGDIYLRKNLDDLAIAQYEKALNIDHRALPPYFNLLQLYSRNAMEEEFTRTQERLAALFQEEDFELEPYMLIGVRSTTSLRERIAQIQSFLMTDGDTLSEETHKFLVRELVSLFYFLCNIEIIEKYPFLNKLQRGGIPASVQDIFTQAVELQRKGALEEAEKMYLKAMKKRPSGENIHRNLGTLYLNMGREEEAIVQYKTAIALNPAVAEYYYSLGYVYMIKEQYEEAAPYLMQAIVLDPDHHSAPQAFFYTQNKIRSRKRDSGYF